MVDLAEDRLEQAVEQVVLVADMAVERHRVDAELLAELAHAQGLDSASIRELDRDEEDSLARERGSALDWTGFADHHVAGLTPGLVWALDKV